MSENIEIFMGQAQSILLETAGKICDKNIVVTAENIYKEPLLQDKTVTENGLVTADEGYDGLNEVLVNVIVPKNEGTAIPTGENVERIYFNTFHSPQETDALLSQLTYIENVFENPTAFIYADTDDGVTGKFIGVYKYDDTHYGIGLITDLNSFQGTILYASPGATSSDYLFYNGWQKADVFALSGGDYDLVPGSIGIFGSSLSEFMGIPVGIENELIKNVISTTPFAPASRKGDPEGTFIKADEEVKRIYLNVNNTLEETDEILSSVTYIQTPFLSYPIYPIFACPDSANSGTGKFLFIVNTGYGYAIDYCEDLINQSFVYLYNSVMDKHTAREGWNSGIVSGDIDAQGVLAFIEIDATGVAEWSGLPVGTENEKLKNVLSVTPFAVDIPDGYILPRGTKDITSNGIYTVVENALVNVNIAEGVAGIISEPTAIQPDQEVNRIYFNTGFGMRETNELLRQLTYIQTDFIEYPINVIYAKVNDAMDGHIILAMKVPHNYFGEACYLTYVNQQYNGGFQSNLSLFSPHTLDEAQLNGGWTYNLCGDNYNWGWLNTTSLGLTGFYGEYIPRTEFNGLPVGAENEKIKDILSTTPFINSYKQGYEDAIAELPLAEDVAF